MKETSIAAATRREAGVASNATESNRLQPGRHPLCGVPPQPGQSNNPTINHNCTFRPPTPEDITTLAREMRAGDRREVLRFAGMDAREAAESSIANSAWCRAAILPDGNLAAIFGACRFNLLEDDCAVAWSLSANAVERNRVAFWRGSLEALGMMKRAMPDVKVFHNWVDLDYAKACRWLVRLGFSRDLGAGTVRGVCGGVFGRFSIRN